MIYSRIAGTGSYLPEKFLTNIDLESMVETSDEWITDRTGIKKRHIAGDDETTTDLAYFAAKNAISAAGIKPRDIDMIIVATTTPTRIFPSTAALVQQKLGIHGCPAFDIQAVCTGFVYALTVADKFIKSGSAKMFWSLARKPYLALSTGLIAIPVFCSVMALVLSYYRHLPNPVLCRPIFIVTVVSMNCYMSQPDLEVLLLKILPISKCRVMTFSKSL